MLNSVIKWLVFLKMNFKWVLEYDKSNLHVKIGQMSMNNSLLLTKMNTFKNNSVIKIKYTY